MSTPSLTIGMAVFDDYDGVYFTITSLMLYHNAVDRDIEFVVVDNNPASKQGQATKKWVEGRVPGGKYFTYTKDNGTAQPRNQVFERSTKDVTFCIDPHVMLAPGAVEAALAYYEEQGPNCKDLVTGPMLMDRGAVAGMFQRPEWGRGALGKWSTPKEYKSPKGTALFFAEPEVADKEPFEIWQQGMGLFSMRREHWVKFHPEFRGFGGCETYVMDRVRQEGGKVVCHPKIGWTHRFGRPNGVPYRPKNNDKMRNYLIGWTALGKDVSEIVSHFRIQHSDVQTILDNPNHRIRGNPNPAPKPQGKRRGLTQASDPNNERAKRAVDKTGTPRRVPPGKIRPITSAKTTKTKRAMIIPETNYTSVVVGHPNYGGTKMRGALLARHLKTKLVHPSKVGGLQRRDIVYYIKDGACGKAIRRTAHRLIYDPLDVFYRTRHTREPTDYWQAQHHEIQFDDIIATSPACFELMVSCMPPEVKVHLVPHQCDMRIKSNWYNPEGPIVYAGITAFIKEKLPEIKEACKRLGRPFIHANPQGTLKGASLALALRCAPYNTKVNRYCKPQIKIENAAAAGLPMVTTDDPATLSQRPELAIYAVPTDFTAEQLYEAMQRALKGTSLQDPYTDRDFLEDIDKILKQRSALDISQEVAVQT